MPAASTDDLPLSDRPAVTGPLRTDHRVIEVARTDGSRAWVEDPALQPDQPIDEVDAASQSEVPATERPLPPTFEHPGTVLVPQGEKARVVANIAALRTIRRLQSEPDTVPTPTDQQTVAAWSGWGGCASVFDLRKPEWEPLRAELAELLDPTEMQRARASTLNAHYTDPVVVEAIWDALATAGFDGGLVLEPGCGSGNFIGLAPESATMVGVEIEPASAAVASTLYPQAQIRNEGFEQTRVPEGAFTSVVGNVPFGNFGVTDPLYNQADHRIHNHFIIKSLHLTAPGGYVAVVTSTGTMDAEKPQARQEMHALGELVSAARLPNSAFERVAATDVATDVLVFRRREPNEKVPDAISEAWIHADRTQIGRDDGQGSSEVAVNRFFLQNPQNVAGTLATGRGAYRDGRLKVLSEDLAEVGQQVNSILTRDITAAVAAGRGLAAKPVGRTEFDSGLATAGDLYSSQKTMGLLEIGDDGEIYEYLNPSEKQLAAIPKNRQVESKALIELADLADALIVGQREGMGQPEKESLRARLNHSYDRYVAKYGPINRQERVGNNPRSQSAIQKRFREAEQEWRNDNGERSMDAAGRLVVAPFAGDLPDEVTADLMEWAQQPTAMQVKQNHLTPVMGDFRIATVLALEKYDSESETAQKSEILSRDVVAAPDRIDRASSPEEAISISLGELGRIEMDRIAELLGVDQAGAIEQTRGLVFPDLRKPEQLVPKSVALSGNIADKIDMVRTLQQEDSDPDRSNRWIDLEQALIAVLPTPRTKDEFARPSPGVTWVPAEVYTQFVGEVFGATRTTVERTSVGWVIDGKRERRSTPKMVSEFGAENRDPAKARDALELFELVINQRPVVVKNSKGEREEGAPEINQAATVLAQVQAEKIKSEFGTWLWSDEQRRDSLLEVWNRRFNSSVVPSHSGEYLQFPGLGPSMEPFSYQRDAVARVLAEPNVLLDHVVGAGKTGTMFMSAMELKRRGLVNQPWIVVPNHLIEQFSREVKIWYPSSKVLVVDKGTGPEGRARFVAQTATSDWDMVICPRSVFERVSVSYERQAKYIERQVLDLQRELEQANLSGATESSVKRIERAKAVLATRAAKLLKKKERDASGVDFESTGCDFIIVDEAHGYKNKARACAVEDLAHPGSGLAEDLAMKLEILRDRAQDRALQEGETITPGAERVALFATGTPIANSMSEAYVFQQFLRPDLLAAADVRSLTDWAANFTRSESQAVTNATGTRLTVQTKVCAFENPRELFGISAQFTDVVVRSQVPKELPRVAGGKRNLIVTVPSQEVRDFIVDLEARLEVLDPKRAHVDNTLKVLNDGRSAALDPGIVGLEREGGRRAVAVAEQAARIYEESKDNRYATAAGTISPTPGALQLVFCDRGTPKKDGSGSVYEDLATELVNRGVPREKVRFIHDAKTPAEARQLQQDCREGKVAVLIGSTEKMGTGMNVQARMIALHHMDVPWRPADLEQREGRIIRQGNQNPEIEIHCYVTEGTTDTVMWQSVEKKAKFIEQARLGQFEEGVTSVDDVSGESLAEAASMTKAAATGDERYLRMVQLEDEVRKLTALAEAHSDNVASARRRIQSATADIPIKQQEISELKQLAQGLDAWEVSGRPITVDGRSGFEKRTDLSEALAKSIHRSWGDLKGLGATQKRTAAEINGVPLSVQRPLEGDNVWVSLEVPGANTMHFTRDEWEKLLVTPSGRSGLLTRVENLYAKIPDYAQRAEVAIRAARDTIETQQAVLEKPFDRSQELTDKRAELASLTLEVKAAQNSPEAKAEREEHARRMREMGREAGWSLQLNPTKAMQPEMLAALHLPEPFQLDVYRHAVKDAWERQAKRNRMTEHGGAYAAASVVLNERAAGTQPAAVDIVMNGRDSAPKRGGYAPVQPRGRSGGSGVGY